MRVKIRLIDADALYNGAMKDEWFRFKEHDNNGRESFAYSCAMQRLAEAPTVDAIPVEWLEKQRDKLSEAWDEEWHEINGLIEQWKEEQEAR